ncbi:DUF3310 domain-containing protein [Staphylococcus saprophyticus]|nr:DUF3310 domain-containing protein [Staphylococcus saprophyticus]
MKIRDLNLNQYVVVKDLGAGKYSSGMRVIGKVVEIDDKGNYAIIESLPKHRYDITDFNDFELWSKQIADKTESMSKVKIKDLNLGDTIRIPHGIMNLEGKVVSINDVFATVHFPSVGHKAIGDESDFKRIRKARKSLDPNKWLEKAIEENKENSKSVLEAGLGISKPTTEYKQSNDVQQRKRKDENVGLFKIKDLKVGYKVKVLGDNMTGEVTEIADNGKSAEIQVDGGVYRVINDNYDFTIIEWNAVPEYAEDRVNSPSHYMLGNHEVKDIVSLVADKYHKGSVAHNIASALEYQMRAPFKNGVEDLKKAQWYLNRAIKNWDVK